MVYSVLSRWITQNELRTRSHFRLSSNIHSCSTKCGTLELGDAKGRTERELGNYSVPGGVRKGAHARAAIE